MISSNITTTIPYNIKDVWNIITDTKNYSSWRSDLSKTESLGESQFIEYTKNNYPTTFSITETKPYEKWEFDMKNSNIEGHWIGEFRDLGDKTEVSFTENISVNNIIMKLLAKTYLKKQQKSFIKDLNKALMKNV